MEVHKEVTIEKLPEILYALGQKHQAENANVTAVLTVLAIALMTDKDEELRQTVLEHFFNPNQPYFNDLRVKELRKRLTVIKCDRGANMETDLKYLFKSRTDTLSAAQRRLLIGICREPTAHLYGKEFMTRYHLTRGGVASALRRLKDRALVSFEDGRWQLQPTELRLWLNAVYEHGPQAAESLRWVTLKPTLESDLNEEMRTCD